MNRSAVLTIARKEFRDVTRDRRTLLFMVLLPIVVLPLLMILGVRFVKSQATQRAQENLIVATDPFTETLLTGLADQWMMEHMGELAAVSLRVGIGEIKGLDDLGQLAERLRKLKEVESQGGGSAGGATLAVYLKEYQSLNEDQQQILQDVMSVSMVARKTEYLRLESIQGLGEVASGVRLPDDTPEILSEDRFLSALQGQEIHAAVYAPQDTFDLLDEAVFPVPITVLYDSSISRSDEVADRFEAFVDVMRRDHLSARLAAQGLAPGFIEPIQMDFANVASTQRRVQSAIGGMLPYFLLIFALMGAFYPSLDLTAGEKERFTLETLLLAPVSRLEIALGKFLVVFTASLLAAVLATMSMVLTITKGVLPPGTSEALDLSFEPLALVLSASLLIPVAAVFSAMLLTVGIFARSFKEAQSYSVPLQFVAIVPAMAAFIPDLQAGVKLAWIPFVNVSLLMRELMKGNYLWSFYGITMFSMTLCTGVMLYIAARQFHRESSLFRT